MTLDAALASMPPVPLAASGRFWALIPCAGVGARAMAHAAAGAAQGATSPQPKQYQPVAGQPMVLHTLAAFAGVGRLLGTLVAVAPGDDFFERLAPVSLRFFVMPCGGATRADTVRGGLLALKARGAGEDDWVLVHDAARCLVTTAQIDALIDACAHDAVGGLLAHKLADTLKTATEGPGGVRVGATVDRSDKWLAQTPQMFRLGPLLQALEHLGAQATDEASAMEAMGHHPRLVPGGAQNFKVTYPDDFALAAAVLAQRMHGATLDRFGGQRGEASAVPARTIF